MDANLVDGNLIADVNHLVTQTINSPDTVSKVQQAVQGFSSNSQVISSISNWFMQIPSFLIGLIQASPLLIGVLIVIIFCLRQFIFKGNLPYIVDWIVSIVVGLILFGFLAVPLTSVFVQQEWIK